MLLQKLNRDMVVPWRKFVWLRSRLGCFLCFFLLMSFWIWWFLPFSLLVFFLLYHFGFCFVFLKSVVHFGLSYYDFWLIVCRLIQWSIKIIFCLMDIVNYVYTDLYCNGVCLFFFWSSDLVFFVHEKFYFCFKEIWSILNRIAQWYISFYFATEIDPKFFSG